MYLFYDSVIKPVLDVLKPKSIVEIGSQHGYNTEKLIEYCREHKSILHTIDPEPQFDAEAWQKEYGKLFVFHKKLSLNALGSIKLMDLVLVDGDHNWYTVYNELKLIERQCTSVSGTLPVMVFHDIGWPYGRRDLYYNPDNIPEAFRKPYKKLGLRPDSAELLEKGGINRHLYNSIYEHNLQNGVLTAIEDFIKETDHKLRFVSIAALSGLGILVQVSLQSENKALKELLDLLCLPDIVKNIMQVLESECIDMKVKFTEKRAQYDNYKQLQEILVEKTKKELENNKAKLNAQIKDIKSSLVDIEKEKSQLREKLDQSKAKEAIQRTLLAERDEKLDKTTEEFAKTRKSLESQIDTLNKKLTKSGEEIVKKTEEHAKTRKALESQIDALNKNLIKTGEEIVKKTEEHAKTRKALESKIEVLNMNLTKSNEELAKKSEEFAKTRELLEKHVVELDKNLDSSSQELEKKTEEFTKTLKLLGQDLAAQKVRVQVLEETLNTFNKNAEAAFKKQTEKNEDDVRLLYAWVVALHETITKIEEIRWWRLGMKLRKLAGKLHIKKPANFASAKAARVLEAACNRKDSAVERLKNIKKENNPYRLFADHIRLFSQWINVLYEMVEFIEQKSFWRAGVKMRRLAGFLRLKPRKFELPTDRAKAIFKSFCEWQKNPVYIGNYKTANGILTSTSSLKAPKKKPELLTVKKNAIDKNPVFHSLMANLLPQVKHTPFEDAYLESENKIKEMLQQSNWTSGRPLVSIIMPSFNRADIITDAIRSVCEQTYPEWELLVCDDGSEDNTEAVVTAIGEPRIIFLKLPHQGAAKARNCGLERAAGEYIAYLDSDNVWHPAYLDFMVGTLAKNTGRYAVFAKYIDVIIKDDSYTVKKWNALEFNYEHLSEKNFIDLNSFVHRTVEYKYLGGFTESLVRQQDWDFILKHTYLRDPLYLDVFLTFYRRNEAWDQLTIVKKEFTETTRATVMANLARYYEKGFPSANIADKPRKVSIVSWDICRNHFSKAYNLAESLTHSGEYEVQLLGFRFFENKIFEPYKDEEPSFETVYIDASEFPAFEGAFAKALMSITGDVVYCIKPRLTSLGLGLMANYHFGKPLVMEANDSEVHVTRPQIDKEIAEIDIETLDLANMELLNPYSLLWSQILDRFAMTLPLLTTHNKNLDEYYGSKSFYMRNLKDEDFYDPALYDREKIRNELGFKPTDRIILFGGLLREHKGIYELVDLIKRMGDDRYKVLFVASRESPDQRKLAENHSDAITILPPQDRNYMAQINYASDLVILWLDPSIPASHYQMPYKFTDAIAMKVPVIANDISDLGDLGHQGYLQLVEFGNLKKLQETVKEIHESSETKKMTEAARKLYLRQFSYRAAKSNFDMIYDTAMQQKTGLLPASGEFADFFARFHQALASSRTGEHK